jgi:hypothetical protein
LCFLLLTPPYTCYYVQKINDDSRYLRGSLTAESPVGRSCELNCSTAVCSYDCVDGAGAQGTKETSLYNFEMCAYDAGTDHDHDHATLTWQDYEFDGGHTRT